MGFAVVGAAGYEGEDVIATLAARCTGRCAIVSGDRDCFALVRDPQVVVLYPVKGVSTLVRVDEAEITRRYGIPGRAYLDFALLPRRSVGRLARRARHRREDGCRARREVRRRSTRSSPRATCPARRRERSPRPRLPGRRADGRAAGRRTMPIPDVSLDLPAQPKDADRLAALAEEHGLATADRARTSRRHRLKSLVERRRAFRCGSRFA